MKRFIKLLIVSAMLILSLGCITTSASAATKTSVMALKKGKTSTIKNTSKVTSSKKKIASAKKKSSTKFKITAKKAGKTTLKVYNKKGKLSQKIYLLVYTNKTMNYDTTAISLKKGSTKKVQATVPKGCTVKYSSSDKSIAKVNSNGKITAVKKGTATIKARVYYKGEKIKTYKKDVKVKAASSSSSSSSSSSASSSADQYSYTVYLVSADKIYSGETYCFYVKTDNTDIDYMYFKGSNINSVVGTWYKDVKSLVDYGNIVPSILQVSGGYLFRACFNDAGTNNVQLMVRNNGESVYSYKAVKSLKINVLDFTTGMNDWIDGMIKKYTTSDMDSFEKMSSIVSYLNSDAAGFRYPANDGTYLTPLTTECGPAFETHVWDSYTSPAYLVKIAERIGGFDDIHNCYGDYAYGSTEWSYSHYLCKVTIGDTTKSYSACPLSSTGMISYNYINFNSIESLTKLG